MDYCKLALLEVFVPRIYNAAPMKLRILYSYTNPNFDAFIFVDCVGVPDTYLHTSQERPLQYFEIVGWQLMKHKLLDSPPQGESKYLHMRKGSFKYKLRYQGIAIRAKVKLEVLEATTKETKTGRVNEMF
jgi:hypothetical protein